MLSTKKLLYKMLQKLNLRIVNTTSPSKTLSAGTSDWLYPPAPTGVGKTLAIVGYVIAGTGNTGCNVYAVRIDNGTPQIAIRNTLTSSATVTATAYFLVSD